MANTYKARYKKYASLGVLFVCVCALASLGRYVPEAVVPPPEEVTETYVAEVAEEYIATGGVVEPQMLRIPKLDMTARFGPTLGLRANKEVEVPTDYDQVGWYEHSPVPGTLGPAVVLGHVDSREGPAVFYALGQLQAGDEIVVERSDGQAVVFEVTMSERYDQSEFPTELVYGDIDHAGLRLVTCSGWYDKERDRYSHNRVVFAELKQS